MFLVLPLAACSHRAGRFSLLEVKSIAHRCSVLMAGMDKVSCARLAPLLGEDRAVQVGWECTLVCPG